MSEASAWEQWRSANNRNWDARVPMHRMKESRYEQEAALVKAGQPSLQPTELAELEGIIGPRTCVLHLQCHIGTDTLSLKHLGAAKVVGLDFSLPALEAAAQLAKDAGIDESAVKWVHSDVYDAVAALDGEQFDLVYCSVGSLCWLHDVARWAGVVGKCLKPGGHFYIRDGHPMAMTLATDEETPGYLDRPRDAHGARELLMAFPYFETQEPMTFVSEESYAGDGHIDDPAARTTHEWNHPIGSIVTSLIQSGLALKFLHEHRDIDFQFQDHMTQKSCFHGRFGGWQLPPHLRDRCPLMYSLLAQKPTE